MLKTLWRILKMFEDLNAAFPNQSYFYIVTGLPMADALERCARLTGDDGHVTNYQNQIIFACSHAVGVNASDIPWLTPVEGSPIDSIATVLDSDSAEIK